MESPVKVPTTIIGTLGGIIGPIVEADTVRAEAKSSGYPALTIAGIIVSKIA